MAETSKTVMEDSTPTSTEKPSAPTVGDDSDPDFDDLDDVLDQFSSAATLPQKQKSSEPIPSASGPGRPEEPPKGQAANETDEEFMTRLSAEMESFMSKMAQDPAAKADSPEAIAKMGKELEEFSMKMEAEGVKPEDILKAVWGEEVGDRVLKAVQNEGDSSGTKKSAAEKAGPRSSAAPSSSKSAFEDTIRRTMARMETSETHAANAAKEAGTTSSEEDMFAALLKSIESAPGAGDGDSELSQLFLGMMEQLTNKDMLYEPMKDLHERYPAWLAKNKATLPAADYARYSNQQRIVTEIVGKFEEPSYTDEDSACREYIWERMQKMQAEGSPPEDLVTNPFPGIPDMGGGGDPEKRVTLKMLGVRRSERK